ncbi:hypothetical protein QMS95_05010, partial [Cronobacter sakazakii]
DAVRTAGINERAGGVGLIRGRKAFKKSRADGGKMKNAVQDVVSGQESDYRRTAVKITHKKPRL